MSTELMESTPGHAGDFGRRIKLDTLVRLRWLAVAGQSTAVLVTHFGLGFPVPLAACFLVIALSAWLNLGLRIRFAANTRLKPGHAAMLLAWDLVQLAALLYLTGGVQNPFVFLFLVPVIVSASALPLPLTLALSGLVIVLTSLLALYFMPLPWYPDAPLELPGLYRFAIWVSLCSSLAFATIYAWRVAKETRLMSDALTATELVLAREQQMSALDGLAAAAAHELGTPLGTISLVSKELLLQTPEDDPRREDIELLRAQAERCRAILAKLTSMPSEGDTHFARMSVQQILEELSEPYRDSRITIEQRLEGKRPYPVLERNPAILYGLGNLLENAVDYASSRVSLSCRWSDEDLWISIEDDGPGFAPDVVDRLGEPYITSRSFQARLGRESSTSGGLGLGFFIAKTLLERTGAEISISNRKTPSGAVVEVHWPRETGKTAAEDEAGAMMPTAS